MTGIDPGLLHAVLLCIGVMVIDWVVGVIKGTALEGFRLSLLREQVKEIALFGGGAFLLVILQAVADSAWQVGAAGVAIAAIGAIILSFVNDIRLKLTALVGS